MVSVTRKNCKDTITSKPGSPMVFKLSYIALILFDTLMFLLAAMKTGMIYRSRLLLGSQSSLVSILLRDGEESLYPINCSTVLFLLIYPSRQYPIRVRRYSLFGVHRNIWRLVNSILAVSNISNFVMFMVRNTGWRRWLGLITRPNYWSSPLTDPPRRLIRTPSCLSWAPGPTARGHTREFWIVVTIIC